MSTLSETVELSSDNTSVQQVSTNKSLRILMNKKLWWHSQIENIAQKIGSGSGVIKRIKPFIPPAKLRYICNALLKPYCNNCVIVSPNCGKTLWDKLQKTLEACCWHCHFLQLWCWCWVLITTIRLKRSDRSASYLFSMFTERIMSGYAIRDSLNKLVVLLPRTNYLKKSLSYRRATTMWYLTRKII